MEARGDATSKVVPVVSEAWPSQDLDKLTVKSEAHEKMKQLLR